MKGCEWVIGAYSKNKPVYNDYTAIKLEYNFLIKVMVYFINVNIKLIQIILFKINIE